MLKEIEQRVQNIMMKRRVSRIEALSILMNRLARLSKSYPKYESYLDAIDKQIDIAEQLEKTKNGNLF